MKKIKDLVKKLLWYIFRIFPINKKKIVIECFNGSGYFDNPRLIAEAMYKQDKSLEIVCLIDYRRIKKVDLPKHVRAVQFKSIKSIFELVTAKLWINDTRKMYFATKRKKQIYVQTWHSGISAKQVEKDVVRTLSPTYVEFAKKDSQLTDYMISSSKWETELYRKSFWYDNEIIELGWPLYDLLLMKDNKKEIDQKYRKILNIPKNKKVLLYVPTFRDDGNLECYDLDFKRILKKLKERYGQEWVVLVRLHRNIANKSDIFTYSDDIINASLIPEIAELEVFSDMVITDYSSAMFESAVMRKTCYLYANDYDEYVKQRDFYSTLFKAPFPRAKTQEELENIILNFDNKNYVQEVNKFLKDVIGLNENPHSSEDIAKFILERMNNK